MKRSIYLDNLKFILIFLVVLGHFANLNRDVPVFGVMNNIIYSFHMPLFIFVSGYLSKNITGYRKKELDQVLYTYLVFEILNLIFTGLTSIGRGGYNIFIPTAQNWYLLGLFFWRLFLPYFRLFQRNTSFVAAVIIGLTVGFYDEFNTFLGLYRVVYFMPFFVLGSYCDDIDGLVDKYKKYRLMFMIILLMSFLSIGIISLYNENFNKAIAYAFTPFKGYGSESIGELYLRFFLRVIGFMASISISVGVLFLVPKKNTVFTKYGRNTLNVYLLHMFVVYPIDWAFKEYRIDVSMMLQIAIISSVIISVALSTAMIDRIMEPLTKASKMFSLKKIGPNEACNSSWMKN